MYLNTVFKYNVFKYCPALSNDLLFFPTSIYIRNISET